MPTKNILLVHDDPSLTEHLQKQPHLNILSTSDTSRFRRKFGRFSPPLVILETKKDYKKDLRRLLSHNGGGHDCYIIIASSGKIKQTAEQIREITELIQKKNSTSTPLAPKPIPAHSTNSGMNLALGDIVENKLRDFIKQMKKTGCRDLYPILLREIEPPLIRLALAETGGNQIQAAQLLGMNRNTLRKKIKELKISLINKKSSRKNKSVSA